MIANALYGILNRVISLKIILYVILLSATLLSVILQNVVAPIVFLSLQKEMATIVFELLPAQKNKSFFFNIFGFFGRIIHKRKEEPI
jgi:hypothetical protein